MLKVGTTLGTRLGLHTVYRDFGDLYRYLEFEDGGWKFISLWVQTLLQKEKLSETVGTYKYFLFKKKKTWVQIHFLYPC